MCRLCLFFCESQHAFTVTGFSVVVLVVVVVLKTKSAVNAQISFSLIGCLHDRTNIEQTSSWLKQAY